jgi:heme O synthase-like polyprenyltransferase
MAKKEVTKVKASNYGLIAYILGIIAIVESLFSPLAGVALGIIGITFSVKEASKLAKRAKILNIVGIVLGVIFFIVILLMSQMQMPY